MEEERGPGGPEPVRVPDEVRLAVVVTGGVSLAVWMGGVVTELARLVTGHGPYGDVLRSLDTRVEVDVIGGTSAGGITGAVLAMALAHGTDASSLRDLWMEHGALDVLLRPVDDPDPPSVLLGDDFFLPKLTEAFRALTGSPSDPDEVPIHLVMTATLLEGRRRSFRDDFGNRFPDLTHLATFTFRRGRGAERDDFALPDSPERLALAARCTASFPGAFEPAYCPIGRSEGGRPDMAWHADFHESKFIVDGGVLMNKPLEPVLRAVLEQPGEGNCRRVLAYVDPAPDIAGRPAVAAAVEAAVSVRPPAPLMARVVASSFLLPRVESLGRELDAIADHNRSLEVQRRLRRAVLGLETQPAAGGREPVDLLSLAANLFPAYLSARAGAAAEFALRRVADEAVWQGDESVQWDATTVRGPLRDAVLASLPARFPPAEEDVERFPWDVATIEALLDTVSDVIAGAGSLPPGEVEAGLDEVARLYLELHDVRRAEAAYWSARPLPSSSSGEPAAVARWAEESVASAPEGSAELAQVVRRAGEVLERTVGDDPRFGPSIPRWLLAAAVVQGALEGGDPTIEQPIELVQISAHAGNGFDPRDDAAEKLAGLQLGHFGAFYKRSWRANDWMWGRLDAATRLLHVVLQPGALRDLARRDPSFPQRFTATVTSVAAPPDDPDLSATLGEGLDLAEVEAELAFLRDSTLPVPPSLPRTVEAVSRRVQLEILQEELPHVADAVSHDLSSGGAERPPAIEFAAAVQTALVGGPASRIGPGGAGDGAGSRLPPAAAAELLSLCRIGAERLEEEAGSPLYERVSQHLTRVLWTAARRQLAHRDAEGPRQSGEAPGDDEAGPGVWGPLARGIAATKGALVATVLLLLGGGIALQMSLEDASSSAWTSIPSAVLFALGVAVATLRAPRRLRSFLLPVLGVGGVLLAALAFGLGPSEVGVWARPTLIAILGVGPFAAGTLGARHRAPTLRLR